MTNEQTMYPRRYFGTDGIRGRVGVDPITADFMLKLGWAAGQILTKGERGRVLIGKDTRISGYMFESVLEAGFTSAGVDVSLLGPMPTPAIAYLTRTLRASASVVISASHNSYTDNGIKFFDANGSKISRQVELEIEQALNTPMHTVISEKLGRANRIVDAAGRYIEFCKRTVPFGMSLKGLRIALDCAHGATYHIAPAVFEELGAEVIAIGCSPNGLNINDGVGATDPTNLKNAVHESRADLGIGFDGDGDRVIIVDADGKVMDGDEILFVIALSHLAQQRLSGSVVGTVMCNLGLEQALQKHGIELLRTAVGDRYVFEQMNASGSSLGGEPSGHIICADRVTTGDGIVAALQVLNEIQRSNQALSELRSEMIKYPQIQRDVTVPDSTDPMTIPAILDTVNEIKSVLADRGRVLVRASGTEPKIRIMVESTDAYEAERLVNELTVCVEQAFAER